MDKKESVKAQDIKDPSFKTKQLKSSTNSKNKNDKSLPWWVELLFVQIGLPDKWLIKILKLKKNSTELIKNEKRLIIIFLFILGGLTYFYPVVKYSKTKLECENIAKKYIKGEKDLIKTNKAQLNMLSTNFCNGGNEINQIKSLID